MRFGAALWVNRTSWPAVREAVEAVEAAGFDTIWIDDHLLADEGAWTDPRYEGWSILAAVAAITTRPRLGLLVGANTFRNPGLTAKLASTVDHVSGGRAILGLGSGWFAREHEAFGFREWGAGFGERLDRLDEAVMLVRRLLDGERVTHGGRFYTFRDALALPTPIQPRLPIMIGGSGPRKTLRTAARYADMWNGYGDPAEIARVSGILRQRCHEEGRAFEEIERTVTLEVVVRDDPDEAVRWWEALADRHGLREAEADDAELSLWGPAAVVAEGLAEYAALGVAEAELVFRDPFDLETIRRLPEVRALIA